MRIFKNSQSGFVSITVAATIMVILVLLTIGFSRVIQREQRQTLDRQLSRQALYAAESGINDVYAQLQSNSSLAARKQKCNADGSDIAGLTLNNVIDAGRGIEYTCVLYDKIPDELSKEVSENESWVLELTNASGDPFTDITISWQEGDGINTGGLDCSTAGVFPSSRIEQPPLLRIDITNIGSDSVSRDTLITNTDYLYVSPCNGSAGVTTHTFGTANNGSVVVVNCDAPGPLYCSLTINGLNSASYMARIRPVYASADVEITGKDARGDARFLGQYSIDVTAKASDVVRRLRATLPTREVEQPPEAVIQAFEGVCKLVSVSPPPTGYKDNCTYP